MILRRKKNVLFFFFLEIIRRYYNFELIICAIMSTVYRICIIKLLKTIFFIMIVLNK